MKAVIGYVYDQPGGMYRNKYYFEGTAEKISIFIMQNEAYATAITDLADNLICSSMPGGFLDCCVDQTFLSEELHPNILKVQFDENYNEIQFVETEPGVMSEIR